MADEDPKKVYKLTVNLSEDVYNALQGLATQQSTTITDALRKAIGTEKFLKEQVANGGKVLVQDADKNIQQVIFR